MHIRATFKARNSQKARFPDGMRLAPLVFNVLFVGSVQRATIVSDLPTFASHLSAHRKYKSSGFRTFPSHIGEFRIISYKLPKIPEMNHESAIAVADAASPAPKVVCVTTDKKRITVAVDVMRLSHKFATMYRNSGMDEKKADFPCEFPVEMEARVFRKVVDWCQEHEGERSALSFSCPLLDRLDSLK